MNAWIIPDINRLYFDTDRNDYLGRKASKLAIMATIDKNLPASIRYQIIQLEAIIASSHIKKASKLHQQITEAIKQVSDDELHAMYHIATGSLLLAKDHVIEAIEAFATGLDLAKKFENSFIYSVGSIWREMAIIHFYESSAIDHLKEMISTYENKDSSWEKSMISAYFLMGSYRLNRPVDINYFQALLSGLSPEFPGPLAQFLSAACLLDLINDNDLLKIAEDIMKYALRCQGMKGEPLILLEFANKNQKFIENSLLFPAFQAWLDRYVKPLQEAQNEEAKALFAHLPDEPIMATQSCLSCDNRCCYDGVYVTYAEEAKIRDFMMKYPDEFKHVPTNFLEKGEWEFLFGGNRTIRVPHEYSRPDFPRHFQKTICVFALPNGLCSLQQSAVKHGMHPWSLKPELCWEFPLVGLFNEDAFNHPHYFDQPDPHYFSEEEPGYLSFLPCAKTDASGLSWKRLYKNELQYYLAKKAKKE